MDPDLSILPDISPDRGNLFGGCATVGLPDITLFSSGLSPIFKGGTIAELRAGIWCIEYSELRSDPSYVVRFEPNPRIFRELPPDQYRFHPELLLVLPRLPPLVLPRGLGPAGSPLEGPAPLSSAKDTVFSSLVASKYGSSCGMGLLMLPL